MSAILPLEFTYRTKTYYALVRKRFREKERQFHVTILNSGLERLLYGHDVFVIDGNGKLHAVSFAKDTLVKELVQSLLEAFQHKVQDFPMPESIIVKQIKPV